MADLGGAEQRMLHTLRALLNTTDMILEHPNLHLSPEERRLFGQVFSAADSEGLGVVTGDVALRFFPEKTKLPPEILGEVRFWRA